MKTITEILAEFRTQPGLMSKDDVLTLKEFLVELKKNLEVFSLVPVYQGTAVNEISASIEKAEWYADYFDNKQSGSLKTVLNP